MPASLGRRLASGAFLVGLGVTAFVIASPFVRLAYHEPALHVVIETATGIAALAIAYLFFLRFRAEGRSADLLLASTYGVAALVNTFLLAVPAAMEAQPRVFSAWAPTIGRSLVVLGLLTAAFHRVRPLRARMPSGWSVALMCVAIVAVIAAVVALTEGSLPAGVDPNVTPTAGRVPDLDGHPVIIAVQVVSMVALFAAAVGFIRQADRRDDELMAWLAASVVLSAFGRLNYALFPSLYSEWISTGDLLRLAAHVVLLGGAAREIRRYWEGLAMAATSDERRRMARELHDGMAQDLALVSGYAGILGTGRSPASTVERIQRSAERALDEARMAIHTLSSEPHKGLIEALKGVLEDVSDRLGVQLHLDVPPSSDASPEVTTALMRIAREATVNAARHGHASTVRVALSEGDGYRLVISDDGSGYAPSADRTGFGLRSMRERAESLGGSFVIRSVPDGGTEVEAWIPAP